MPRTKTANLDQPFQSIKNAARLTGLSQCFIRTGVRNGSIPFIRCGGDYRINMPLWLDMLNAESQAACTDTEGR